jgi:hypothetical protein
MLRELADSEQDADHDGANDGYHRREERLEQSFDEELDDGGGDERLPPLRGELVLDRQLPDDCAGDEEQADHGRDGDQPVTSNRSWSRRVEQDAAHRVTAQRRSRRLAPKEISSTITM